MTLEEINKRLAEIEASAHDHEAAHNLEDQLFRDFIVYVDSDAGALDPHLQVKASAVLKSLEIKFGRHYA